MAVKKIRKHVLNAEGTYDIEHYETDANIVLTDSGENVQIKVDEHDAHVDDSNIHVTTADKEKWDGKEEAGSAATAETNAKEYAETLIEWGYF